MRWAKQLDEIKSPRCRKKISVQTLLRKHFWSASPFHLPAAKGTEEWWRKMRTFPSPQRQ